MPTGRFYFFIFVMAFLFAAMYFVVMYIISAMKKRALGTVNVVHSFEDKKAEIDVEALKKQKEAELRRYREEKLSKRGKRK